MILYSSCRTICSRCKAVPGFILHLYSYFRTSHCQNVCSSEIRRRFVGDSFKAVQGFTAKLYVLYRFYIDPTKFLASFFKNLF
jgi:hypothetical protein